MACLKLIARQLRRTTHRDVPLCRCAVTRRAGELAEAVFPTLPYPTLAKLAARSCWSCMSVYMAACQNLRSLKGLPATHSGETG